MNRRHFIVVSVLAAGAAAASLYSLDKLSLLNSPMIANLLEQKGSTGVSSQDAIPHLLRRAGFGASAPELATYQSVGFEAAVDRLVNYENVDNGSLAAEPAISMAVDTQSPQTDLQTLRWWWMNRMIATQRPLEEKMTLFWHNHFATAISKVRSPYLMYLQNRFLRANALGNFRDILMGITTDPAMLIWLDGNRSMKGNPNENYAREIMEVFSTGRGPYTENDVKEAARALTGYVVNKDGTVSFNAARHDGGTKTFLGQTGNLGAEDVVNTLVEHPATASTLAAELFSFLAYPYPSKETVSKIAQVYTSSGFSIRAVVDAILRSEEFLSSSAYLANVKSPTEFVVTALRSTGATVGVTGALGSMTNMGQSLFNPPTVFGWPSGLGWIDSASVLERYNFPVLMRTTKEDASSQLDAAALFDSGQAPGGGPRALGKMLFPDGVPADFLKVVGSSVSTMNDPVSKTKDALRLTMASPFYMLN